VKKNMGSADRTARLVVAVIIAVLYLTHAIAGTLAIVLLIFAGVFALTSFTGLCPLYSLFGINTRKKTK
jgi:hypothetical protein